eukprot:352144-Chlamydomonas_euryale.AAC.2
MYAEWDCSPGVGARLCSELGRACGSEPARAAHGSKPQSSIDSSVTRPACTVRHSGTLPSNTLSCRCRAFRRLRRYALERPVGAFAQLDWRDRRRRRGRTSGRSSSGRRAPLRHGLRAQADADESGQAARRAVLWRHGVRLQLGLWLLVEPLNMTGQGPTVPGGSMHMDPPNDERMAVIAARSATRLNSLEAPAERCPDHSVCPGTPADPACAAACRRRQGGSGAAARGRPRGAQRQPGGLQHEERPLRLLSCAPRMACTRGEPLQLRQPDRVCQWGAHDDGGRLGLSEGQGSKTFPGWQRLALPEQVQPSR